MERRNSSRSHANMKKRDISDRNENSENMNERNRKNLKNGVREEKVVFEGNAFYEIDLECVRKKQQGKGMI